MSRRGYSLVELLIATALGMTLCFTAAAALRLASQATTSASRMSLENAIMRAGFLQAHEDLDWWTSYDDPGATGSTANPLRATSQPFAPMATAFGVTTSGGGGEADTGWDDAYRWPAADKRSWQRANLAEKWSTAMVFGRYATLSNVDATPSLGDVGANAGGTYGAVTVPHTWLARQLAGLETALGHYAFAEYLPPNTLFAFARSCAPMPANAQWATPGLTNLDGVEQFLVFPDHGPDPDNPSPTQNAFEPGEGGTEVPKSLWRLTMPAAFAIPKPGNAAAAGAYFRIGYQGADATSAAPDTAFGDFVAQTAVDARLLSLRPVAWPDASVRCMRFIKTRRFVNLYSVTYVDSASGEQVQLSFTAFGTSLRGARQQRAPTGGWAAWDDAPGASCGATLDGPARSHP